MVTRHAHVIEILRDAESFTMEPESERANPMEDILGPMMLSIDGPDHKRIRDVFIEPFRPRHVRQWYTDLIREISHQLVDDLLARVSTSSVTDTNEATVPPVAGGRRGGGSSDLDKEFSDKLAIYTVVAAIGFEVNDLSQFRDWYEALGAAIGNTMGDEAVRQQGKAAFEQFRQVVLAQLERLKVKPNNSVLSEIVHNARDSAGRARLTTDEIVSNIALTFFGGVETTSAMLSNTIWALLTHPDQFEQVCQDPSLLPNALEEALRWEAPVQSAMRFPTRDVVVADVPIRRGEKIHSMLGAANRDPALFEEPDRFDIHRKNANQHLSFAYGPHFCFGAPLARLEATIGLPILFERLERLHLDPSHPTKPVGHEFRSPPTLVCQWGL